MKSSKEYVIAVKECMDLSLESSAGSRRPNEDRHYSLQIIIKTVAFTISTSAGIIHCCSEAGNVA